MKLFFLLVIVTLGFSSTHAIVSFEDYSDKLKENAKVWHDKCVADTGISEAKVDELRHGKFEGDSEIKKKYVGCIWKVTGVMDNSHKIIPDKMKALLSEKTAVKALQIYIKCTIKCASKAIAITNFNDFVYAIEQCYHEEDPKGYIMV